MKKYILNTNLIFHASRLSKKDAYGALLGTQFKTTDTPNKSSKIDVQYEKESKNIHLYMKPRCYVKNYVFDKSYTYVGILDTDWTINESDYTLIKEMCAKHNIIPIFSSPGDFTTMINDILNADTFTYTHSKLNHREIYNQYVLFNDKVREALDVNDNDVVWAQDFSFIHVISQYKNSIMSLPKFNELWKCIPFYNILLTDMLKVKVLDFISPDDISDFKKFVSYTFFPDNFVLPKLVNINKGIDKDFVDDILLKGTHFDKNTIVVPYESIHHLICLDKYLNKYDILLHVYLLNIDSSKDISQEVLNYLNYLTLKTNVEIITPESDEDFFKLISKCQIGFYKSLDDYFKHFNRHIIESDVYDYEMVADEIYKKLHYVEQKNEFVSDIKDDVINLLDSVHCRNEIEYKRESIELPNVSQCTGQVVKKEIVLNTENNFNSTDESINDEKSCNIPENSSKNSSTNNTILLKDLPTDNIKTIILDYDGTLVPLCANPADAILPEDHKKILLDLNKHIKVVISTGRCREDMDKFIPKELEVFAEHCTFLRQNGNWTRLFPKCDFDLEYRIAKFYAERSPGSQLELKENGFVFHYRNCDPLFATNQGRKLYTDLIKISDNIKLGKKIIEYKVSSKEDIFKYYDNQLMVVGDDLTDEDMFDNGRGITIRVGCCDKSRAEYFVKDVSSLIDVLQGLIKEE